MAINLSKEDLLDMWVNFQKYALEKWTGEYCKIDGNIISIKNFLIDSSAYYWTELNISWKYWDFIVGSENNFTFKDGIWNVSQNAEWLTLSWEHLTIWKLGDIVSIIAFKYQDNVQSWYSFTTNNVNAKEYKDVPYCTWSIIKPESVQKSTQEPQNIQPINNTQIYYLFWIIIFLIVLIWILLYKIFSRKN